MQEQITVDQLIHWYSIFQSIKDPSQQVKDIITSLETRLHDILTQLTPVPTTTTNQGS